MRKLNINNKQLNLEEDIIKCIKEGVCEYCLLTKQTSIFTLNVLFPIIRSICQECHNKYITTYRYSTPVFTELVIDELFMLRALMES